MPATPRRRPHVNHAGIHHLRSVAALRAIVGSADLSPTDLVYDLGAGPGTLTVALVRSGARVVAVERDPRFVVALRRRFAGHDRVTVVPADLRTVRIPRRARVVANLPFATSSAVIARLLDPAGRLRHGVDLLVEHGFALRTVDRCPRSLQAAWRAARYEIEIVRRVPRTAFVPQPRVDAALLRIRPRAPLDGETERRLRGLLAAAYSGRHLRAVTIARQSAGRRAGPRLLASSGLPPNCGPLEVPPHVWAMIARRA